MKRMLEIILEVLGFSRVVLLVLVLGIGGDCIAYGVWRIKDLYNFGTWVIKEQADLPLTLTGLLLATSSAVVALTTIDKRRPSLVRLSGSFHYVVFDVCKRPIHSGKVVVECEDGKMRFKGHRCYTTTVRNGRLVSAVCYVPWESSWTYVADDGGLRCEYRISAYHGYFRLPYRELKSGKKEVEGIYYLFPSMPERDGAASELMYGTIRFIRVDDHEYDGVKPPIS